VRYEISEREAKLSLDELAKLRPAPVER